MAEELRFNDSKESLEAVRATFDILDELEGDEAQPEMPENPDMQAVDYEVRVVEDPEIQKDLYQMWGEAQDLQFRHKLSDEALRFIANPRMFDE